jgi:hypothetical protein
MPSEFQLSTQDRSAVESVTSALEQLVLNLAGLSEHGKKAVLARLNDAASLSDDKSSEAVMHSHLIQPTKTAPIRQSLPNLPDPRYIRKILRNRQARTRFFSKEIFADPAWDMLLDLSASCSEYRRVSVTSLCMAADVPATTALRWVGVLCEEGLCKREPDPLDKRRTYIALTDSGIRTVANYFAAIGTNQLAVL